MLNFLKIIKHIISKTGNKHIQIYLEEKNRKAKLTFFRAYFFSNHKSHLFHVGIKTRQAKIYRTTDKLRATLWIIKRPFTLEKMIHKQPVILMFSKWVDKSRFLLILNFPQAHIVCYTQARNKNLVVSGFDPSPSSVFTVTVSHTSTFFHRITSSFPN